MLNSIRRISSSRNSILSLPDFLSDISSTEPFWKISFRLKFVHQRFSIGLLFSCYRRLFIRPPTLLNEVQSLHLEFSSDEQTETSFPYRSWFVRHCFLGWSQYQLLTDPEEMTLNFSLHILNLQKIYNWPKISPFFFRTHNISSLK